MNPGVLPTSLTQLRPTHVCLIIINPPTSIRTNHYLHATGRIAALNCDFERRAGDISVDHPTLVEFYRAPQAIAVRDELREVKVVKQEPMPAKQLAAHA